MIEDDDILALNELTGRVHRYEGTGPGGIRHDDDDFGVGLLSCGCEGFEEAAETDNLIMIRGKHLKRGIWEPAPCLGEDDG